MYVTVRSVIKEGDGTCAPACPYYMGAVNEGHGYYRLRELWRYDVGAIPNTHTYGLLAQLVERQTEDLRVGSSILSEAIKTGEVFVSTFLFFLVCLTPP